MRLCYLGNLASIHVQRWAGFFARKGHDVHVISTTELQDHGLVPFRTYSLPTRRTGSYVRDLTWAVLDAPGLVARLKSLIGQISPDLVHVHYVNEAAVYCLLAGFRPVVVTAWGSDILVSPKRSWIRRRAVRYVVRHADLITCDADHMKRAITGLGAGPDKVQVVFFGTDVERYSPSRRDPALRARFGSRGAHVAISIRSLEPGYDVESLIRAVPVVLERFPSSIFLIGGNGSQAGALQRLAEELGVGDSVEFLGAVSQDDLPAYLASSDVYVSTALSDGGIAASTAEAMASGLPVVITDVGDNRQWAESNVHGFLVPPSDPRQLGDAVIHLLEDEGLRERMGRAGRAVIEERNNLQREMSRMEALYRQVTAGRPRSP